MVLTNIGIVVRHARAPPTAFGSARFAARFLHKSSQTSSSRLMNADHHHHAAAAAAASKAAESSTVTNEVKLLPNTERPQFLRDLSPMDLTCFSLLSVMTAPSILKWSIKIMPFVPNFLVKTFVYPIYCGGETWKELQGTARKLLDRGISNMMISYSVEDAEGTKGSIMDQAVPQIMGSVDQVLVPHYEKAERLFKEGVVSAAPASGYVAIKPTGLMSEAGDILKNYNNPAYAEKWQAYLDVCRTICRHAQTHGNGKVVITFDAEKKHLQEGVYEAQRVMMREFNRDGKVIVIGTIQMYLQDSVAQLKKEMELAEKDNYQIGMKLVRGAYIHSEPDRWNTIHRTKEASDESYNTGASMMMDSIVEGWKTPGKGPIDGTRPVVGRLVVATHNEESCAMIDQRIRNEAPLSLDLDADESVVFGQLMGMADDQSSELARRGRKVIKYVPWGPAKETKDYLVRRLEENGDAVREGGWKYARYGVAEAFRRLFRF